MVLFNKDYHILCDKLLFTVKTFNNKKKIQNKTCKKNVN